MRRLDTWFGGPDEPLLGFLTLPDDGRARAGIVVCPPLGHEQMLAYRSLRLLADDLAGRGFAALRFDYAGLGDSAGDAAVTDSFERWMSSITAAVRLLREGGVDEIALVGLTSGALLAAEAARGIPEVGALVLWDPDVSGRRFLRRQRSLYEFTELGEDAGLPGQVSLLGLDLHPATVDRLEGLAIDAADLPSTARHVLVLGREQSAGAERLTAALPEGSYREIPGQGELLEVPGTISRFPVEAIAEIVGFLDDRLPHDSRPVTVPVRADASVSAGNTPVQERLHRIGPNALFAVETLPESGSARATVILQPGAAEHRTGPGRFQARLARELAGDGFRVVRFDRLRTGETTPVRADEPTMVFAEEWIDDTARIADAFADAPLATIGLCSGAWVGARFATRREVPLTVMMSPNYYKTRTLAPGEFSAMQRAGRDDFDAGTGLKARIRNRMPGWLWRMLAPLQLFHDPAQLLTPLAGRPGSEVLLMLTPLDHESFHRHRGFETLARLRRRGFDVRERLYAFGDHSLLGARIRAEVSRDLHDLLVAEFPPVAPAHDPVPLAVGGAGAR